MIRWVWERAAEVVGGARVWVATDSDRIAGVCSDLGMQWVMTPEACLTGTDRVAAANDRIGADLVINLQGDEPTVRPAEIERVIRAAEDNPGEVINGMCPLADDDEHRRHSVPKVVSSEDGRLLYMSRAPIPMAKDGTLAGGWKQVCVYAIPRSALERFAARGEKTPAESIEDIEILRFVEMGVPVRMIEMRGGVVAVDTPEDVARAERALCSMPSTVVDLPETTRA